MQHSPYGPVYLKAIKKKVNIVPNHSVFVITVDPWVVSINRTTEKDDSLSFRENGSFLSEISNSKFLTAIKYFHHQPFKEVFYSSISKSKTTMLHSDGWLEVTIPMDSISFSKRLIEKTKEYEDLAREFVPSKVRMQYLDSTVNFFKSRRAHVFLFRLPVHSNIKRIEDSYFGSFNYEMQQIADKNNIPYLDLSNLKDVRTTDGNHIYKASSKLVSSIVAKVVAGDYVDLDSK
jgi:hypothetical protein